MRAYTREGSTQKYRVMLSADTVLIQKIEGAIGNVVVWHICISAVSPGSAPTIPDNEDLLAIVVADQQHGMQPVFGRLWIAGVWCGDEPSWQRPKEVGSELEPKDDGVPGRKGRAHGIQVHRNLLRTRDFVAQGLVETRRIRFVVHPVQVVRPIP